MPATWSSYVAILVTGMILTGATNSIFTKYQDMQCVENCDGSKPVVFEQPVWQTLQMFVGEMLCFLPVTYALAASYRRSHVQLPNSEDTDSDDPVHHHATLVAPKQADLAGWRILLFWIPAACDLTGTTFMNIGLLYTPVSIYQMTRGALVLFVGMLSVAFLRRRLWLYQWAALVTVMLGVSVVGLSGSMIKDYGPHELPGKTSLTETPKPEASTVLVGVFFIIFAQIFTATQFVVEEKIMANYSVAPLLAVGYEGFFGFITILIFMPILAKFADRSPFFDLPRGWDQIVNTPSVLWSSVAIAISISLFNGFGLSVTRHLSATARSVIDTCRTLLIWIISLGLGWERLLFPISLLQVVGFGLLVYGTFLFNNLVNPPACIRPPVVDRARVDAVEEEQALLRSEALDATATLPADLGTSGFDVVPQRVQPVGES